MWDIHELMMHAGEWPMVPSLGREWCIPGPASQDGLAIGVRDDAKSETSCQHIVEMLNFMKKHPSQGGAEVMEMPRFWHEKMSWYGPAGRTGAAFRDSAIGIKCHSWAVCLIERLCG